jgi:hypothetical protein
MEMNLSKNSKRIAHILMPLGLTALTLAQSQKPMTNADVIQMVKSKLPESVVVQAIQSHPGKFDTSTQALIALHKAGVTEMEMNAMMGKSGATANLPGAPSNSPQPSNAGPPPSKSRMPKVYLMQGGGSQELPLEKTQLAETKTKPSSMSSLAADSAVTQALQVGINTAAMETAMHMNSPIGGSTMQQAGGIVSGIMAHRKPTVTYVWGVPNPTSSNVVPTAAPTFSVDVSRVPGVNPDEFAPAIVKLTPAQNTCRIVGATQGKEDARSSSAADWQIYSHFLEERVAATPQKLERGKYRISPASELAPGEYAVVLRPVSHDKRFSGGDVARVQGDGLMFDAVWTFQVAETEQ